MPEYYLTTIGSNRLETLEFDDADWKRFGVGSVPDEDQYLRKLILVAAGRLMPRFPDGVFHMTAGGTSISSRRLAENRGG